MPAPGVRSRGASRRGAERVVPRAPVLVDRVSSGRRPRGEDPSLCELARPLLKEWRHRKEVTVSQLRSCLGVVLTAFAACACNAEWSSVVPGDASESFGAQLGTGDLSVLMVVDRSGSMAESWEGSPKWKVAQSALEQALVGVETELTIGALQFPLHEDCEVVPLSDPAQIEFQRGDHFRERWLRSKVSEPDGATPLGEAFRQAHVAVLHAQETGLLEQRFRVVVITDGEPTCGEYPDDLVAYADQWRDMGVDVRVMGLPGSAPAANLLNRIAGVELFEDPTTGEVVAPEAGDRWEVGDDTGYVEPPGGDDVDDSLHSIVR